MPQDQVRARPAPSVTGWWIAAVVAVAAVVGVIVLLAGRGPLPLAEAAAPSGAVQADRTLAAAQNAANRAARSAQSAVESKASVTEIAARAAAGRSAATVQSVAAGHDAALAEAAATPR